MGKKTCNFSEIPQFIKAAVFLVRQADAFRLSSSPPPRRDASTGKRKKLHLSALCASVVRYYFGQWL